MDIPEKDVELIVKKARLLSKMYARSHRPWMRKFLIEEDDLQHEGLIRAFQKYSEWDSGKGNLSTYMSHTIYGAFGDYYRKYYPKYQENWKPFLYHIVKVDNTDLDYIKATSSEPCILESLEQAQLRDKIRTALNKLPDNVKLVLILLYYKDLKGVQVSSIIKRNPSRVSQIKMQGLQCLREIL